MSVCKLCQGVMLLCADMSATCEKDDCQQLWNQGSCQVHCSTILLTDNTQTRPKLVFDD